MAISLVDMPLGGNGTIKAETGAIARTSPASPGRSLTPSVAHGPAFRAATVNPTVATARAAGGDAAVGR
ncbi:hypothetical protein [uncultured Albimonas sp.]|uniref:hypothetical protein n=1 Tax=uncultured Albimonas sp. TaxID=1331701 RepID=UPI0030EF2F11|tara:strand:- start:2084 stop:2290 length:207 start_codon:yes stop_codon:yes gene_type:complete